MGGGDKATDPHRAASTILRSRAGVRLGAADRAAVVINANGDPSRFAAIPACRWCPTACRISPARWPAFWPGSTGRRRNTPRHRMDRERARAIARSCRDDLGRRTACGAAAERDSRSPARSRATGAIRWRGCGRWRCARTCAAPWSRKTCARSRCGPRAMASRSPNGRTRRSIRSSTSTRRKMWQRRRLLRPSGLMREPAQRRGSTGTDAQRPLRAPAPPPHAAVTPSARVRQEADRLASAISVTSSYFRKPVGFGQRGQITPAPSCGYFTTSIRRPRASRYAHVLAAPPSSCSEKSRAPAARSAAPAARPQAQQQRPHHAHERHEHRDRIARQADERRAVHSTPIATGRPGLMPTRQNTSLPTVSTASRT